LDLDVFSSILFDAFSHPFRIVERTFIIQPSFRPPVGFLMLSCRVQDLPDRLVKRPNCKF